MPQESEGARRPNDDKPADEASSGLPPEPTEGVDAESGQGREALSREKLYERLSAVDDPDAEDDPDEPGTQVQDPQDAPAEEDGELDERDDEPEEDAADAPKADAPPSDTDEEDDEASPLLGRVPDSEWRSLSPQTRERISALRADRKAKAQELERFRQLEPVTKYGEAVLTWAEQNRVSDVDMSVLLDIGAKFQQGGEVAIKEALRIAQHYGYKPQDSAPKTPDALPDWLQKRVDNLDMTEEAAWDVVKQYAEQQAPAKEQPAPQRPQLNYDEAVLHQSKQQLATAQAEAAKKYGASWASMWPKVQREMLKEKGADPRTWAVLFKKSLELVEAHEAAAKPQGRLGKDLAPGSVQQQGRPDPEELTGRARLLAKYTRARV